MMQGKVDTHMQTIKLKPNYNVYKDELKMDQILNNVRVKKHLKEKM